MLSIIYILSSIIYDIAYDIAHDIVYNIDKAYPYRHTEEVKAQVEAARREHLDDRGQVKVNHLSKVLISYMISY